MVRQLPLLTPYSYFCIPYKFSLEKLKITGLGIKLINDD